MLTLPLRSWSLWLDPIPRPLSNSRRIPRPRIGRDVGSIRSHFSILNGKLGDALLLTSRALWARFTIHHAKRLNHAAQALTYGIGAETSFEFALSVPAESTAVVT